MCCSRAEVQVHPVSFQTQGGSDVTRRFTVSPAVSLGLATSKTSDLLLELCRHVAPVLRYKYFRFHSRHMMVPMAVEG
jgi:hypothetical protein